MKNTKEYDVLFIGNYTKDIIITPTETKTVDGGAVNYAAHAAVRLEKDVAVITHLAREDARMVDALISSGVDCYPVFTPHSTSITLDYPTTNPDLRKLSVTEVADHIPGQETEEISSRAAVIGSTLRGEVGLDVVQSLHRRGIPIGLDVQGFVRVLRRTELIYEPWPEMAAILKMVDFLKSDAVEAEFLTGKSDIREAALYYSDLGAREIVLTHKDGLLVYAAGQFIERAFFPSALIGRSGRGDTCLGTYVATRLDNSPGIAATWAAAVTSMKMEKLGPFDRSIQEVRNFIATHYDHGTAV